jgi:hypothetical protein
VRYLISRNKRDYFCEFSVYFWAAAESSLSFAVDCEGESMFVEGWWGVSRWSVGRVFWRVGVSGPFAALALFLRFLYSFSETDFLVEGGVLESVGCGDLGTLEAGESLVLPAGSSRLRLGSGGDSLASFALRVS